jgi:hypothetical protein
MSPSDMIDDSDHIGRVLALEAAVDGMRSQNEATHQLLQDVLDKLGPPQAQNAPDPIRPPSTHNTRPPSVSASSAGRKKNLLRPSAPPDFDGTRSGGKAFLTSCRTYIRLCPEAFDDDDTIKIVWAMSYMKSGRAGRWATREFEHEAKSGHLRFIDWLDFEEEFRKDFLPLDSEAAAVNALETTSYFQGKRSVDDYLDQFRDLIEDSGYTDPKTIVVKFRRGLDRRISTALAGMAAGRPSDTDPKTWFRLAVQMDQNRAADEAFHTSYRQTSLPTSTTRLPTPLRSVPTAPPARFAHSNPSPGNPVPMDIDAARKNKTPPDTCRRCGKTGHWSKDCDLRFDVRYMNEDELEMELENRLAAKDVAASEAPSDLEPLVSVEDFVPRSR